MDKALHIKNLSVNYGNTTAISNICLEVNDKEFLGIIGPNGGGKSTFLKAVLGLIKYSEGEVNIYGNQISKVTGKIGYVPQIAQMDKTFPINALEVVMTGFLQGNMHPFFKYTKSHREQAENILEKVGLKALKGRQINGLSGGEFQRLLIARALAVDPKILFLDEPTASVDPMSRQTIYTLLSELNKNITIIMVTHDLFAISSKVTSIACLNKELVYHGVPELTEDVVNRLYGCPVDLIAHGVPHRVLKMHQGGQDK